MSLYSPDEEEEKILQRQINKDLAHAIGHIENDELGMAINILKKALEREKKTRRNEDK